MQVRDRTELKQKVRALVREELACDLYTRLSPTPLEAGQSGLEAMLLHQPALRTQLRHMGIDEIQGPEVQRVANAVLVENAPLSDAAQNILKALNLLGIPLEGRAPLKGKREKDQYQQTVMQTAKLRTVLCRLDPLEEGAADVRPLLGAGYYLDVTGLQRQNRVQGFPDLGISPADVQVGTQYLKLAAWLFQLSLDEGAHMMLVDLTDKEEFDQEAFLRHVVLPTCAKAGLTLMLRLPDATCEADLRHLKGLMEFAPELRVMCVALGEASGLALVREAALESRLFAALPAIPCVLEAALQQLGTCFSLHSGGTEVLDLLLGQWSRIRPMVAQALYARYAPLLGLEIALTEEMIQADVGRVMGGAWEDFLRQGDHILETDVVME